MGRSARCRAHTSAHRTEASTGDPSPPPTGRRRLKMLFPCAHRRRTLSTRREAEGLRNGFSTHHVSQGHTVVSEVRV